MGTLGVASSSSFGALQSYYLANTKGDVMAVASLSVAAWGLETTQGSPCLLPIAS